MKLHPIIIIICLFVLDIKVYSQNNINFENGNLNGWTITNVKNVSSIPIQTCCAGSFTPTIHNSAALDPNFFMNLASPLGGTFVVRLNQPANVSKELSIIHNTLAVTSANNNLKIAARWFLEKSLHNCNSQPFVNIKVTDVANTFTIFNHFVQANEYLNAGPCSGSNFTPTSLGLGNYSNAYYYSGNSWEVFCIDLSPYIGNNIKVELMASECSNGDHGGYVYFDVLNSSHTSTNNTFNINNTSYSVTSNPLNVGLCSINSASAAAPPAATSYTWYGPVINGSNSPTVQINQAGSYTLNTYSPYHAGCTNIPSSAIVQFTIGSIPNIGITSSPTLVCQGTPVTFSLSGATAYSVSSTYSFTSYSSYPNITVSPATSNTFFITGYNSAGCSATNTLNVTVIPSPTISVSGNSLCANTQATLTAFGADTYTWSQYSTTLAIGNQYIFTPTTAGFYSVTGTYTSTGCNTTYVFYAPVSSNVLSVTPTPSICIGNSITLNASGSTNQYTWSPFNTTNYNITVNPTVTTTYTLSSSNACGLISTPITLTVIPLPVLNIVGPTSVCPLDTYTWNVTGGDMSYYFSGISNTYSYLYPTAIVSVNSSSPPYLSVTASNTNGCTSSTSMAITVLPSPNLSVNNYNASICLGNTITLVASGATSYTWNNSSNSSSIVVSPTLNTAYNYTAIGANGCRGYLNTSVFVNSANPTISPIASNYTVCSGQSINLGQNLSQCCSISYSINNQSVSNPNIFYPTASGMHTLTVQNGCGSVQNTFSVDVIPSPSITSVLCVDSACYKSVLTLTINGTSGNTYYVSGPIQVISPTTNSIITFTLIGTGNITVYAINASGCFGGYTQKYIKTLLPPFMNITASTNSFCPGSPVTLTVTGSPYSYTWSTSSTNSIITVNPTTPVTISVASTNTNGCVGTTFKTLTPLATPTININASPSQSVCIGNSAALIASGADSYTWNTTSTLSIINITPTISGVYSVSGYSLNNSCPSSNSITITVLPLPIVGFSSPTYTVCSGGTAVLTGTGGSSYWFPNPGVPTATANITNATSTNTYAVIGYSNGCSATAICTLIIIPNPSVSISSSSTSICNGHTITLTANGANSYSWNTAATTTTINQVPQNTTSYSVTGIDLNGCSSQGTIAITVNPKPIVTINSSSTSICAGNTVALTASATNTYSWSTASTANAVVVSPIASSSYSVIGFNSFGCSDTAYISITVNPLPTVTVGGPNFLCIGESATLTANGVANYTWNPGPQTNSMVISPVINSTYTLVGSDANNCKNFAIKTVSVYAYPVLSVNSSTNVICSGQSTTLSASGATSYTWSNSSSTFSTMVSPNSTSIYTVYGEISPGCAKSKTIEITALVSPTVTLTSSSPMLCVGHLATITAVGATSYSWSNSSFNYFIVTSPAINTTYTVTGFNTNGCSDIAIITQSMAPCTDLLSHDIHFDVSVFPNPTNGIIYIQNNSLEKYLDVIILNALGELVFSQKLDQDINFINLDLYANGIYYMKLQNGQSVRVIKIIKE